MRSIHGKKIFRDKEPYAMNTPLNKEGPTIPAPLSNVISSLGNGVNNTPLSTDEMICELKMLFDKGLFGRGHMDNQRYFQLKLLLGDLLK